MTINNPLQNSIYQSLNGDSTLMGQISGVFDHVVQGCEFPYVAFGESSSKDWSASLSPGTEEIFTIDIFSREGGKKQSITIMERIYALLQDAALTVEGYSLVSLRLQSSGVGLENDGWTYHGHMKFKALLQAA